MFSEINSFIRTKDEQNLFLREIDILTTSIYKSGQKSFEATLDSDVRLESANLIKNLIKKDSDAKKVLEELKKETEGLAEIKIEIAVEPSGLMIQSIFDWLTKNVKEAFVISFVVNSSVVAGATVAYQGKFYNGSLSEPITKFIQDKNEK